VFVAIFLATFHRSPELSSNVAASGEEHAFGDVEYFGLLNNSDIELMDSVLAKVLIAEHDNIGKMTENGKIYWFNLHQSGSKTVSFDNLQFLNDSEKEALPGFLRRVVCLTHTDCDQYLIDGASIIINPRTTRVAQPFHIDYTLNYNEVFIPLTELQVGNALHSIEVSSDCKYDKSALDRLVNVTHNIEDIDVTHIHEAGCEYYIIKQFICRKYGIFKINERTIHRGIPNTSGYDRIMFNIATFRKGKGDFEDANDGRFQLNSPLYQTFDDAHPENVY